MSKKPQTYDKKKSKFQEDDEYASFQPESKSKGKEKDRPWVKNKKTYEEPTE